MATSMAVFVGFIIIALVFISAIGLDNILDLIQSSTSYIPLLNTLIECIISAIRWLTHNSILHALYCIAILAVNAVYQWVLVNAIQNHGQFRQPL